jgi:26S proteasome regulatory subunit N9
MITDQLVDLTKDEVFNEGSDLITLFHGFVEDLSANINHLKYI